MKNSDRRATRSKQHEWLCQARKKDRALLLAPKVPKRRLVRGAVVWVHVPYERNDGEKLRPAIVVGCHGRQVSIRKLTSSPARLRYEFYVDIVDLDQAGLDRPCGIDLRSSADVDRIEIVDIAGELSDADFLRLQVGACVTGFLQTH